MDTSVLDKPRVRSEDECWQYRIPCRENGLRLEEDDYYTASSLFVTPAPEAEENDPVDEYVCGYWSPFDLQ